jgi:ABC-2 type transport system ATP-binding protein
MATVNIPGTVSPIFQLDNVSVNYGFRRAVEGLSLTLQKGQSLGLLGVNGAGKTSTIRALLGMLKPKEGKVSVFGGPPGRLKALRRIGFAPEDGVPPEYLTASEYLGFVGGLKIKDSALRHKEMNELLDWFELVPKKKLRDFSKGMKRRLILAQAFLGTPELLILDEPLNGLDPLVIIKLRERLDAYRAQGGTLLFSSHILSEVEKSCSHVAILSSGKMVCHSPVAALVGEFGSVESAFAEKVKGL